MEPGTWNLYTAPMGRVRILSDVLAHKIAAGEIVDRPASVVKELVENSLDAQATRVIVRIENGGKRLISVLDDGFGMSIEDAKTAFLHHATSKISTFEDLTRISTLGFRGEALPSMAAVSRLTLRTIERSDGADPKPGFELSFEAGKIAGSREIAWPEGTLVEVRELFYNVPARQKFMKSIVTEIQHISKQVTHYALAYPDVEFQLHHQQRPLIEAPGVKSLEDRVYQILGESFLENLAAIDYEREGVRITGYTSLPHEQRSTSRAQYLFVNRRVIRDRVMGHAIRLAYQDLIPSSSHPVVLLFLNIDPVEIDVNVHPSKTEIRFRNSRRVHRCIHHALEESLLRPRETLGDLARDIPLSHLRTQTLPGHQQNVARSIEKFFHRHPDSSLGFREFRGYPGDTGPAGAATSTPVSGEDPHRFNIPETADLSPLPVVLGQFVESFVVVSDREGVMLIDQHVAHERILFDQALRTMSAGQKVPTQRLLMPQTVELTAEQKTLLEPLLEHLNSNGFEVEWFGEKTIVLKGVPSIARDCRELPKLMEEIIASVDVDPSAIGSGAEVQRLREKIAISVSCRSAIKINTPLSPEKMRWLVDELFRCENPYTCPHGRPITLRMNIEDVLRGFKRI